MAIRLVDHLRRLSDDGLAALLAARPDLAVPVPDDLAALASRAQSRLSVARALEGLDLFTLEILDALRLVADGGLGSVDGAGSTGGAGAVGGAGGAGPTGSTGAIGGAGDVRSAGGGSAGGGTAGLATVLELAGEVPAERVRDAVARLRGLALAYGPDEEIAVVHTVAELCSPYLAGLGRPAAELDPVAADLMADPARLRRELLRTPPESRAVLDRLAAGPPVGTVRAPAAVTTGEAPDTPVGWLIRHHLLVAERVDTVQLPRELGLLLRRETGPLGTLHPDPPAITGTSVSGDAADAAGAGQVMELVRLTALLADTLAAEPAPVLRSGGIGVRDLRRLARVTGLTEPITALLLEVARHAELLSDGASESPAWLPTAAYDTWRTAPPADRWLTLAAAWLAMPRAPGLVGTRDLKDKPINALSGEVSRMSAPVVRAAALAVLADLPAGAAPPVDDLIAVLAWRAPRRAGAWAARTGEEPGAGDPVRAALAEAATLGMIGRGALTRYGRALLAGGPVTDRLADLLPAPVTEMLLQADLTIVVPGPPAAELAAELDLVADTESAGQATVYRLTPDSVRRALDAGMSAADLHALLARRSVTPVPQAVSYLVDDVARRHGGLRIGRCGSYVRADDPALLAEVAADRRLGMLGLRLIAPTVLVSPFQPDRLLELLRDAGYPPVVEDGDGVVLTARPPAPRAAPASYPRRAVRELPDRLSDETVAQVVAALRRNERAARTTRRAPTPDVRSTADALGVLNEAIRARQMVWVGYVDAHGGTASRLVRPVSIGAGYLRAADDRTETLHTFALHRITSATPTTDSTPAG